MHEKTKRGAALEQEKETQPPRAVSGHEERGRTKVVVIDGGLHSRLKERAAREGKKLQALVETKLIELVETEMRTSR